MAFLETRVDQYEAIIALANKLKERKTVPKPSYVQKFRSAAELLAKGYTADDLEEATGELKDPDQPAPKRAKKAAKNAKKAVINVPMESSSESEAESEENEAVVEVVDKAESGDNGPDLPIPGPVTTRTGRQTKRPRHLDD